MGLPVSPQITRLLNRQRERERENQRSQTMCFSDRNCIFIEILLAILLPPLGVFFRHGCCSCEFCVCLLLTMLGYVPGMIYAVYVIVTVDPDYDRYREYYIPISTY